MKTFVIAEAAATHDGSLYQAQRLVWLAKNIGADAVKFQWLSSPFRLAERRHAPDYLDAYQLLQFPLSWFDVLAQECALAGVEFMCTAYLIEDIPVIARYVQRFKISSFEALDERFILAHAPYTKPLIISAGMNAGQNLRLHSYQVVCERLSEARVTDIAVLHCVSGYPTPYDQINLGVLRHYSYGAAFQGLSDHTLHPWTGGLAVAAGARIIEFHVRLDDTSPTNADFTVARTEREAAEYVDNIRTAELMLGSGVPQVMTIEQDMQQYRATA